MPESYLLMLVDGSEALGLRLCDVPIPGDASRNSSWLEQAQRDGNLQGSYIEH